MATKTKTTERDTTYNGWTNYPTWNVNLWIDNEEHSQCYWRRQTERAIRRAATDSNVAAKIWTVPEAARFTLAEQLKSEFEEADPCVERADMWSDIMGWALEMVNWQEIADAMIEAVDD